MSCSHPQVYNGRICSCRRCLSCKKKQINDWVVRMELESRLHPNASWFITLTYRPEALPKDAVFNKKDYQNYIKRIRITFARKGFNYNINYFIAGEYGSLNGRPHYHIILFGIPFTEENKQILNDLWFKYNGFTCIKSATLQNIRYCAKYCNKSLQKSKEFEKIDSDTGEVLERKLISEFTSMSKKIPIGWCFLSKNLDYVKKVFSQGFIELGKYRYSVPNSFRYYVKKMNICSDIKKEIVILYNEEKIDISNYKGSQSLYYFMNNVFEDWKVDLDAQNVKMISFKDYFDDIQEVLDKEKNYCIIHKIDFSDYYRNKYRYVFPILNCNNEKSKFIFYDNKYEKKYDFFDYFYKQNNQTKDYIEFIKTVFYKNYEFLFY